MHVVFLLSATNHGNLEQPQRYTPAVSGCLVQLPTGCSFSRSQKAKQRGLDRPTASPKASFCPVQFSQQGEAAFTGCSFLIFIKITRNAIHYEENGSFFSPPPRFLRAAPPSYLAGAQARSPTTRASATLPPAASTGHAGAPPLPPRARAREPRMPAIQHRRPSLSSSPAAGTSLP